ncbi:hypothetical protein HDU67_009848 [Dinochytrium kinnereticum]|nr:hypothetical protein HDU67_009848 [Dinochytrium kinnereticum]
MALLQKRRPLPSPKQQHLQQPRLPENSNRIDPRKPDPPPSSSPQPPPDQRPNIIIEDIPLNDNSNVNNGKRLPDVYPQTSSRDPTTTTSKATITDTEPPLTANTLPNDDDETLGPGLLPTDDGPIDNRRTQDMSSSSLEPETTAVSPSLGDAPSSSSFLAGDDLVVTAAPSSSSSSQTLLPPIIIVSPFVPAFPTQVPVGGGGNLQISNLAAQPGPSSNDVPASPTSPSTPLPPNAGPIFPSPGGSPANGQPSNGATATNPFSTSMPMALIIGGIGSVMVLATVFLLVVRGRARQKRRGRSDDVLDMVAGRGRGLDDGDVGPRKVGVVDVDVEGGKDEPPSSLSTRSPMTEVRTLPPLLHVPSSASGPIMLDAPLGGSSTTSPRSPSTLARSHAGVARSSWSREVLASVSSNVDEQHVSPAAAFEAESFLVGGCGGAVMRDETDQRSVRSAASDLSLASEDDGEEGSTRHPVNRPHLSVYASRASLYTLDEGVEDGGERSDIVDRYRHRWGSDAPPVELYSHKPRDGDGVVGRPRRTTMESLEEEVVSWVEDSEEYYHGEGGGFDEEEEEEEEEDEGVYDGEDEEGECPFGMHYQSHTPDDAFHFRQVYPPPPLDVSHPHGWPHRAPAYAPPPPPPPSIVPFKLLRQPSSSPKRAAMAAGRRLALRMATTTSRSDDVEALVESVVGGGRGEEARRSFCATRSLVVQLARVLTHRPVRGSPLRVAAFGGRCRRGGGGDGAGGRGGRGSCGGCGRRVGGGKRRSMVSLTGGSVGSPRKRSVSFTIPEALVGTGTGTGAGAGAGAGMGVVREGAPLVLLRKRSDPGGWRGEDGCSVGGVSGGGAAAVGRRRRVSDAPSVASSATSSFGRESVCSGCSGCEEEGGGEGASVRSFCRCSFGGRGV